MVTLIFFFKRHVGLFKLDSVYDESDSYGKGFSINVNPLPLLPPVSTQLLSSCDSKRVGERGQVHIRCLKENPTPLGSNGRGV